MLKLPINASIYFTPLYPLNIRASTSAAADAANTPPPNLLFLVGMPLSSIAEDFGGGIVFKIDTSSK